MDSLDERIRKAMSKDVKAKTLLCSKEDLNRIIKEHLDLGWNLVKQDEVNGKIKVTFNMVK